MAVSALAMPPAMQEGTGRAVAPPPPGPPPAGAGGAGGGRRAFRRANVQHRPAADTGRKLANAESAPMPVPPPAARSGGAHSGTGGEGGGDGPTTGKENVAWGARHREDEDGGTERFGGEDDLAFAATQRNVPHRARGEIAVLELRSPTPDFSPPPPPKRRECDNEGVISPPSPSSPPVSHHAYARSAPPPPPAVISRPNPAAAGRSSNSRSAASQQPRRQPARANGMNPTPKVRYDATAVDAPATMLGGRAAGTPARTLRERVNALEKDKNRLEAENRLKTDENAALRERLANLEAALLSDLDERIDAALINTDPGSSTDVSPSTDVPSPAASPRAAAMAAYTSGGSRPSESAAIEAAEARTRTMLHELRFERDRAEGLQKDVETLETALQESEMQRRGFASRFAFCLLDADHDGIIDCSEVRRYELFASYSEGTMDAIWEHWDFAASGSRGLLTLDDFVLLSNFAEEKTSKQSSAFWFAVADGDGDGYITFPDVRRMYELAVDGMPLDAAPSIGLDALWCQLSDMSKPKHPACGIALADIRSSGLAFGIFGLLFNHHNMLGQRSTLEWSRHDYPL